MSSANRPRSPVSITAMLQLVIAVGLVFGVSMLGQLATLRSINDWYVDLVKPDFSPPNVVFPLVWSLLYALMALAFWRILRIFPEVSGRKSAIFIFLIQLALNLAWSWAFFGLKSPVAGLIVILALDIAVAATLDRFWRLDRLAGVMLAPYLLWIAFATMLNGAILALN